MMTFGSRMPEYAPGVPALNMAQIFRTVVPPTGQLQREPTFQNIQDHVQNYEGRLLQELFGLPAGTHLRRAVRLVTGPFLLPPTVYGMDKPSTSDRAKSATLQHTIVEAILAGTSPNASPNYSRVIHQYIQHANHMFFEGHGARLNMDRFWKGVLTEAAIIHTFLSTGDYILVMPEFNKIDPNTGYSQEVKAWDVNKGIDFVLIHEKAGHALLVDAKGLNFQRYGDGTYDVRRVTHAQIDKEGDPIPASGFTNYREHRLPESLVDALLTYDAKDAQRVTITIPPGRFKTPGMLTPQDGNYKQALTDFLTLLPEDKAYILNALAA